MVFGETRFILRVIGLNEDEENEDTFDIELEKLVVSEKRPTLYKKLKLDFNPFPVTGIARPEHLFPPIRSGVQNSIIEYIKSTYRQQEFGGLVIKGDYGMGKSHLLRYTAKKINKILRKKEYPAIAVYIDNPGMNSRRLMQSILENIGLDELRKYIGIIVLDQFDLSFQKEEMNFLKKFFPKQLPLIREKNFKSLISEPRRSTFFAFLDKYEKLGLDSKKMQEFVKKSIFENIVEDTFAAEQFTSLLFGDDFSVYRSWESITSDLKTRQSSEKSQRAFLKGVIRILKEQKFSHLYIVLDEFEDITISRRISRPKTAEYLSMIRIFVDEHIPELSIIIGSAPKGWNVVKRELPALASRFREIELGSLNVEQIRELLKNYLDIARDEESEFKELRGSIKPFSKETLPYLLKKSEGNVRSLLITCHRLIEYAVERGVTKINAQLCERFDKERMPYVTVK